VAEMFASVNGVRVIEGRITIPFVGLWHADVRLDTTTTLPSDPKAITLTLGNLVLVGTKFRAADYQGSLRSRLVGGAAGWAKPLKKAFYKHDAGVLVSLVLGDAARELGETVSVQTDRSLGARWARIAMPRGARLIRQVAGDGWFITPAGVTTIGTRANGPIVSPYDVLTADGALGHFVIASDAPGDFAPGRTFATPTLGIRTVSCVDHHITKESIRTEVQT
jgi:hypothetical protein